MKDEYDFSSGVRSKFYSPEAEYNLPVYLKPELARKMGQVARERNTDVGELVNNFLEKNLENLKSN